MSNNPRSPRLELDIEELIIEDAEGLSGAAVKEALLAELAVLLASEDTSAALFRHGPRTIPRLSTGALNLPAQPTALQVGRQLARSVCGSLAQGTQARPPGGSAGPGSRPDKQRGAP